MTKKEVQRLVLYALDQGTPYPLYNEPRRAIQNIIGELAKLGLVDEQKALDQLNPSFPPRVAIP